MAAPTYSWDEDSAETRVAPPSRWPHSRIADDESDERFSGAGRPADSAPTTLMRRPSWRNRASAPPPEPQHLVDESTLIAQPRAPYPAQREISVVEQLPLPPPRPAGQVFPIFGSSASLSRIPMVSAVLEVEPAQPQPQPQPQPAPFRRTSTVIMPRAVTPGIDLLAPTRARSGTDITPPPSTLPPHRAPQAPLSLPLGLSWSTVGAILGTFSAILSLVVGIYFLTPQHGQLRIELTAEGGAPITKAEIFVDGHKHCDTAPCIVADLTPGARTIQVIAPGFAAPLTSSEVVEPGRERIALIPLRPTTTEQAAPAAAPLVEPSPPPVAEPEKVDPPAPVAALVVPPLALRPGPAAQVSIKSIPSSAPAAASREKPAASEEPVAPTGMGRLNVNSMPASKVLVDGRALGSTPKVDITIPAGVHTVTFVHPDFGKKSVTVTVKPGQGSTASVRFRKKD